MKTRIITLMVCPVCLDAVIKADVYSVNCSCIGHEATKRWAIEVELCAMVLAKVLRQVVQ